MRARLSIHISAILALFLSCAGSNCADFDMASLGTSFYTQATNDFQKAHFIKPSQNKESDLSFTMAPLLIQETFGVEAEQENDRFGALTLTNGALALDLQNPTVYASVDTVQLNRRPHNRFTYFWCYSLKRGPTNALSVQGVRITSDSKGSPVMWEVLADPSGIPLIFVAQSLEKAAELQYGEPLRDRRHAVEAKISKKFIVVPRVLDDGPMPMGPMLYLNANSHAIASIACRCMRTQARSLLSTSEYHLEPLTSELRRLLSTTFGVKGDLFPLKPGELEKALRLPRTF
jgi:hypothetical protein